MTSLSITVPGVPQGKGRARHTVRGGHVRTYTPQQTVVYENWIKMCAIRAMEERNFQPITEGPVWLFLDMHMPVPKSVSKRDRARMFAGELFPTKKPDVDNVLKAVFDGLNATAFRDDVQICSGGWRKIYALEPKLIITLSRQP